MIGIIGAMEEEIEILKSQMTALEEIKVAHVIFYKGYLNDKEIVLTQSGIGKVNAAISTSLLIDRFEPDCIINTGSAGGLQPELELGDVVVSRHVAYHDVDACAFGYAQGQIPGMPAQFEADTVLFEKVMHLLEQLDQTGKSGLIVSGDSFIGTNEQREAILAHFPDALATEMEATAIAQTCYQYRVPFIITRAISDLANKEAGMTFEAFLKIAAKSSSEMVNELVKVL
ncbi:5'-methylthioadenosine/adenosylhomocysteine nucleosidase [Staphylococcus lutrae]|uniref:5'-methylthioadenosine/S-adenosylhomocysteine nucleosidase n=1 Tax=Staphylococcus lutrae TaxID=155085 RepID=A0AAC9RQW0_9STAP|nr:5'-methylthioadenosine/adenosylhomocysteine nucleosidase [Staphylococcus lutrae]ARJ49909.1 5'-methylthioadenosine/S-adenosylhomocysteine nucleosidase [Staphylococcus lutrae]PNZ38616.1 5'-methylthioadenosine/adenosylhomocysteine nucleosidase [Staphylococcus lutrae]